MTIVSSFSVVLILDEAVKGSLRFVGAKSRPPMRDCCYILFVLYILFVPVTVGQCKKKTSQFKTVCNGDTAYVAKLKQQKSKRC